MRPLRSLLVYLGVVFLLGALLAPWLHALVAWGGEHWAWLHELAEKPFHRYVNRTVEILALLGLWPLLRGLGVRSWADVGIVSPSGQWRRLGAGFGLGFVSLACAAAIGLAAGARTFRPELSGTWLVNQVANAIFTAAAVAVLEELLFRGALFGGLRRAHPWPLALIISSAVYAWVHFFEKPPSPEVIHWYTGIVVLGQMCSGLAEVDKLVPAFFTLFLVGSILALAYQRTGNLYLSIGLHGGWVFWLKFYRAATVESGQNPCLWLLGSRKLVDGWLTCLLLIGVWVWVWKAFSTGPADAGQD